MPDIIIPARNASTLKQEGTEFVWTDGAYRAIIEKSEVRELPQMRDRIFAGYISDEGERLTIVLGSIEPLENQPSPGQRKFFIDLVLQNVGADGTVWSIENFADAPKEAWQLDRSAKFIANLAGALGAAEQVDENTLRIPDAFVQQLRDNAFAGNVIGINLYTNKGKNGKSYTEVESFFRA